MTQFELHKYGRRLRAMAARLNGEVAELRNEALQPTGSETGGANDTQADPGAQAAGEGVAVALLGAEGQTLAEVNAALDRIAHATYGRCERCRRPITRARLDILPFARRCVRCASAVEAEATS